MPKKSLMRSRQQYIATLCMNSANKLNAAQNQKTMYSNSSASSNAAHQQNGPGASSRGTNGSTNLQSAGNVALHTANYAAHQRQKKSALQTYTKSKNRSAKHAPSRGVIALRRKRNQRHPYQRLVSDTLHIIFQYLIVNVSKRCIRKLDPQQTIILQEYATNFEFESHCDNKLKSFFKILNGKVATKAKRKHNTSPRSTILSTTSTTSLASPPHHMGNKILHYVKINKHNRIGRLFKFFNSIHTLDLTGLVDQSVTDEDFECLRGIQQLFISSTSFSISEQAFEHLCGIHTLHAANCVHLTDRACESLVGVKDLDITSCMNMSDAAFQYIGSDCAVLKMAGLKGISWKAFSHLSRVQELDMSWLKDEVLTDARTYKHLVCVEVVVCRQKNFSFVVRDHLKGLNAKVVRV